jgi:capsular polysaccharide transport system permease protein
MSDHRRNAFAVTWSVWKALLLREAVSRLFYRRAAWAWVLAEPLVHIAFLSVISIVIRQRTVSGIDVVLWLMAGVFSFFMFRRPAVEGTDAIGDNSSLFAYRQVKPIDTVIVRCILEAVLLLSVALFAFFGAALFGVVFRFDAPLLVFGGVFGLWLLGLGWALVMSVPAEMVTELGKVVDAMIRPLYLMSGVIFPLAIVPYPFRDWLLYNPIVHGLEAVRLGFSSYYHAIPELSLSYLYAWALVLIFFGLVVQVRFARRVIEQ